MAGRQACARRKRVLFHNSRRDTCLNLINCVYDDLPLERYVKLEFEKFEQENKTDRNIPHTSPVNVVKMETILNIACVIVGALLAGVAWYFLSQKMSGTVNGFPWATLGMHWLICLLILFLYYLISPHLLFAFLVFITAGFYLGSIVYSFFFPEALVLLHSGHFWRYAAYVFLNILPAAICLFVGAVWTYICGMALGWRN